MLFRRMVKSCEKVNFFLVLHKSCQKIIIILLKTDIKKKNNNFRELKYSGSIFIDFINHFEVFIKRLTPL